MTNSGVCAVSAVNAVAPSDRGFYIGNRIGDELPVTLPVLQDGTGEKDESIIKHQIRFHLIALMSSKFNLRVSLPLHWSISRL